MNYENAADVADTHGGSDATTRTEAAPAAGAGAQRWTKGIVRHAACCYVVHKDLAEQATKV